LPVPKKLLNAPTGWPKPWVTARGTVYPHDLGGLAPGETYLPDELIRRRYYEPRDSGEERAIGERLRALRGEDE
jgi:putative ATPase